MARISLALSGSGFKFPVHIGALSAIEETKHQIVEISGTSGGAVVAAMWACGIDYKKMLSIAMDTNWKPYIKLELDGLLNGGINTGKKILDFCETVSEGRTFSDITENLSIVSVDLLTNEPFVFSKQTTPNAKIAEAVRASISIPLMFTPFSFQGKLLVDGAVSNNLPLNQLFEKDSVKIGVKIINTGLAYPLLSNHPGPFQLARRAIYHLLDRSNEWALESGHFGKMVKVFTEYTPGLDANMPLSMRERLLQDGYIEMRKILSTLRS